MALCSSGIMALGGSTEGRSVNLELDRSPTACIQMGEAEVRELAERPTGAICMENFYGKSSRPPPPGALGTCYQGGFYIGTIFAASTCYYLIVSPNTTGCALCQWKITRTATAGTDSCVDGFSNTYGPMNNTSHPAGNFTATRTINGFSDWYMPARDELNQLYVNDGGQANTTLPTGEGFSGSYWSSTERSATQGCGQTFFNGSIACANKTPYNLGVRAVRREPI